MRKVFLIIVIFMSVMINGICQTPGDLGNVRYVRERDMPSYFMPYKLFSQNQYKGWRFFKEVGTINDRFDEEVDRGTFVFVNDSNIMYKMLIKFPATFNMKQVFSNGNYIKLFSTGSGGGGSGSVSSILINNGLGTIVAASANPIVTYGSFAINADTTYLIAYNDTLYAKKTETRYHAYQTFEPKITALNDTTKFWDSQKNFKKIYWSNIYGKPTLPIGTVTSVELANGTGIHITGTNPITSSGIMTITNVAKDSTYLHAGVGIQLDSAGGNTYKITNSFPNVTRTINSGTGINVIGTDPTWTITNTSTDATRTISAGTGISVSGTDPSWTITNTKPDKIRSINPGRGVHVSGLDPSWTLSIDTTILPINIWDSTLWYTRANIYGGHDVINKGGTVDIAKNLYIEDTLIINDQSGGKLISPVQFAYVTSGLANIKASTKFLSSIYYQNPSDAKTSKTVYWNPSTKKLTVGDTAKGGGSTVDTTKNPFYYDSGGIRQRKDDLRVGLGVPPSLFSKLSVYATIPLGIPSYGIDVYNNYVDMAGIHSVGGNGGSYSGGTSAGIGVHGVGFSGIVGESNSIIAGKGFGGYFYGDLYSDSIILGHSRVARGSSLLKILTIDTTNGEIYHYNMPTGGGTYTAGYRMRLTGTQFNNINYHNTIDTVSNSIPYNSTSTTVKMLLTDTANGGKLYRRAIPTGGTGTNYWSQGTKWSKNTLWPTDSSYGVSLKYGHIRDSISFPWAGHLKWNSGESPIDISMGNYGSGIDNLVLRVDGGTGMYVPSGLYGGDLVSDTYLKLTATTTPDVPVEGMIYQKSSDHNLYHYDGSGWSKLNNQVPVAGYRIGVSGSTVNNTSYRKNIDSISSSIPYTSTLKKVVMVDTTNGVLYRHSISGWDDGINMWKYSNRMGFYFNQKGTMSWSEADSTLTLTQPFTYVVAGVPYTITSTKTKKLPGGYNAKTTYFFYFTDGTGTITVSTTPWTLEENEVKIPIAIVKWDALASGGYKSFIEDERHTCLIDREMHQYLHSQLGCRLTSGGTVSGYTVTPATAATASNQMRVAAASIQDDDLDMDLAVKGKPLTSAHSWLKFVRTTATTWKWDTTAAPYPYAAGTYIQWDNGGTMTTGINNRYYNSYLVLTNAGTTPMGAASKSDSARFIIVSGRGEYTSAALAQAENPKSFDWTGFDIAETVILYQFTWFAQSSSTGALGLVKLASTPVLINQSISSTSVPTAVNLWTTIGTQDQQNTNAGNVKIGSASSGAPQHTLAIVKQAAGLNIVDPNYNKDRSDSVKSADSSSFLAQIVQGNPTLNMKNRRGQSILTNDTAANFTVGSSSYGGTFITNATLGNELAPALTGNSGVNWTLSSTTGYTQPFASTIEKTGDGTGTITPTAATNISSSTYYRITITFASLSAGTVGVTMGGINVTNAISSAGTYTEDIFTTSTAKILLTPINASRFVISAISIKSIADGTGEITGKHKLKTNIITNLDNREAIRFDAVGRAFIGVAAIPSSSYGLQVGTSYSQNGINITAGSYTISGTSAISYASNALKMSASGECGIYNTSTNAASSLGFYSKNALGMTLNPSQWLGIGTSSPRRRLHVTGSSLFTDTVWIGEPTGAYSYIVGGTGIVNSSTKDIKQNIQDWEIPDSLLEKMLIVNPKLYSFRPSTFRHNIQRSDVCDSVRINDTSSIFRKLSDEEVTEKYRALVVSDSLNAEAKSKNIIKGFLAEDINGVFLHEDRKEISTTDLIVILWKTNQALIRRTNDLETRLKAIEDKLK